MKKPGRLARYYGIYKKTFGYLIEIFPYVFFAGIAGMFVGNIVIGERAWAFVYYVTVWPVIVLWLLGTGGGCLWWLAMRHGSEKNLSVFTGHGLILLAVGGVFGSGGVMFLKMGIEDILGL